PPDTGDGGQDGGIAVDDMRAEVIQLHRRQRGEGQLRTDPGYPQHHLEDPLLLARAEAEEQHGILTDVVVREQPNGPADLGQLLERGRGDVEQVSDSLNVDDDLSGA